MAYSGKRRKQQALETKMKLYNSAVTLFTAYDYSAVTVKMIVDMAGVSKGSFYVHFASKDALFRTLVMDKVELSDLDYQTFLQTLPDAPADAVLLAFVGKIADVLKEDIGREKMRALYKAQLAHTAGSDVAFDYNRTLYNLFTRLLRTGSERGDIRLCYDPEDVSRHLVMAIRGVAHEWCVRGDDFDFKAHVLQHFRMFLDGLRPGCG